MSAAVRAAVGGGWRVACRARRTDVGGCLHEEAHPLKPFLRWAGGKQYLAAEIVRCVPPIPPGQRYYEPFVGAGAVFLRLRPAAAILSDRNEHLIETYRQVRAAPELVAAYLVEHTERDCAKYYYEIRDVYNSSSFSPAQAARFIYLNKTCFNGIFRVNVKGEFNVPYGCRRSHAIPSLETLERLAQAFRGVDFVACEYTEAVATARAGDFIYLDPPYPPLNGTSYFTHYTKERFSEEDQRRLRGVAGELRSRGCHVMMSNADTQSVRNLYAGWHVCSFPVPRWITCKSNKHRVSELLITSYPTTLSSGWEV